MKTSVLINFSVDKENKKILVERGFDADVKLVWTAWTDSKILDQWWAPKPWKAETKSMNFEEGGMWLYAMVGPANEKHWGRVDYIKIEKQKFYTMKDFFSDEYGKVNSDLPGADWKVSFNANDDATKVTIEIKFKELKDLEQMMEMGFKEGFTAAFTNLDHLLESKK